MKRLLTILPLLIILFIASGFRLWNLGDMPYGLADDEARIIYSAYSIWHTGHDISGAFLPFSITIDEAFSPVYIYATAPFVGIFGLSPFMGRLPFALMNIGSMVVLYLLIKELSRKKLIALLASFVFAVSPWGIHIARGAHDANFALFFFLLAIYLFIKHVEKGSVLWSLPAFLFAFYSYHATKIFFLALIPLLIIYYWGSLKKRKKEVILFLLGVFTILLSFFLINYFQPVKRAQVLLWNNTEEATKAVNYERTYNTAPAVLEQALSNKPLYFLRKLRENYLSAFSPEFLFLYGDPGPDKLHTSLFSRGQMYIIELIFLLAGMYYVIRYKQGNLLLFLIIIAPFAATPTGEKTYFNRAIMMLPVLCAFVGYGLYFVFSGIHKKGRVIFVTLLTITVLWYLFLIASFAYQYFYRYSLSGSEGWNGSTRQLVEYILANQKRYDKIYISSVGTTFLLQYGTFSGMAPSVMQENWHKEIRDIKVDNVQYLDYCIPYVREFLNNNPHVMYIAPAEANRCDNNESPSETIKDRGQELRALWNIYY